MEHPEHYMDDVLRFFDGRPEELALYQTLEERLAAALPDTRVKVQRTQISFYDKHLFAAASLPVRRRREWPEHCLLVTVGLARPLDSPRAAVTVEPYPGRWTNHIPVARQEEIDGELLAWLAEARDFARSK